MKASAAAVQSIIGEVFSDVSFEEFERGSSTVSVSTQSLRSCFYFFSLYPLAEVWTVQWRTDPQLAVHVP
jgi:hypothetical protein